MNIPSLNVGLLFDNVRFLHLINQTHYQPYPCAGCLQAQFTHKENLMAVTDTLFVTELDEETGEFSIDQPPALALTILDVCCPECGEFLRQGQLDTEPPVPFIFCGNNCDLRGYAF